MKDFIKTVVIALQCIALTTVLSFIYGFIARGRLTFAYVFNWNFAVGTFFLCVALLLFFLPAALVHNKLTGKIPGFKPDNLTDHSTYMERNYAGKHLKKQAKAYEVLTLGLLVMVISSVIQLLLSFIVP